MKKQKYFFTKKGMGLIEVVVGVSILTVSLFTISSFYQKAINASSTTTKLIQASFLLEEGIEATRFLRDESWENISTLEKNLDYYLIFDGLTWSTTTTNTLIDGLFERKLNVQGVYRDLSDDISSTLGSVLDPNIKQVTISVSWIDGTSTTTRTLSTYLTNFFAS